jgi:hypothetical protein
MQSHLSSSLHTGPIVGLFTAAYSVIQTTMVSSYRVILPALLLLVWYITLSSKSLGPAMMPACPTEKAALNACCVSAIRRDRPIFVNILLSITTE